MHHDDTIATQVGNPSVFGHGMLTAGLMARVVKDWLGPESLRRFSVRFAKQVWPGETLTFTATRDRGARRRRRPRSPGRRTPTARSSSPVTATAAVAGLRGYRWDCSTGGSRSSRDRVAGSGASSRSAWRARAPELVVNDVGVSLDGQGTDEDPAAQVCKEIEAFGGQAVPNYDSVTDFDGRERIIGTAIDSFGQIDILVNNAGIVRDRSLLKMSRGRLRRGRGGAHEGRVQLHPSRGAVHEGRRLRPHHQHHVVGGSAWQLRPDQLRRRQGRAHGHDVHLGASSSASTGSP